MTGVPCTSKCLASSRAFVAISAPDDTWRILQDTYTQISHTVTAITSATIHTLHTTNVVLTIHQTVVILRRLQKLHKPNVKTLLTTTLRHL